MVGFMILLVPKWTYEYPEFWNTIRRRNIWFIKIRYCIALSVFGFLIVGHNLLSFNFTPLQIKAQILICLSIILYNVIIDYSKSIVGIIPSEFNAMHLSLMQILLDFTVLMLLVYYTGTIESPFYMFFILHMVVGSLILPGYLIKTICFIVIAIFSLLVYLQRIDLIESHFIRGITIDLTRPLNYDVLFLLVFATIMISTVFIANRIARNLLKREEQLRQTLIQLDEVEKSKQRYLMGVVHEIKTPISAIESIVDIILQKYVGPISEEVEKKLLRIKERSGEGLIMINNILKISKLKLLEQVETDEILIDEIIKEFLEENIDKTDYIKLSIKFTDDREIKKPLFGDKELLKLAISNIVSNSAKYVENSGILDILVKDINSQLFIDISDNGIGIPEGEINKIFDQFYRATNTKSRKTEGSGLGLSLVKEIIARHGGTIKAISPSRIGNEVHPGTSIIIKLPYQADDDDEGTTLIPLQGGL